MSAAGAEAGRQLRRIELLDAGRGLDPPRSEEVVTRNAPLRVRFRGAHVNPAVSSRPSIRLRFWIPWLDAPFQMLSIAAKAITLPCSATVT